MEHNFSFCSQNKRQGIDSNIVYQVHQDTAEIRLIADTLVEKKRLGMLGTIERNVRDVMNIVWLGQG